jgi:late competence protein required for DNA uptake (superfamily II DNA/RNA helicase)
MFQLGEIVHVHGILLMKKMSDKNLEQRINIRCCVVIGRSASETLTLLTLACGEYAMKKSSVLEWHRWFKQGQEDVQDDPRN